eukprot:285980-Rhodomonas_salina.2
MLQSDSVSCLPLCIQGTSFGSLSLSTSQFYSSSQAASAKRSKGQRWRASSGCRERLSRAGPGAAKRFVANQAASSETAKSSTRKGNFSTNCTASA